MMKISIVHTSGSAKYSHAIKFATKGRFNHSLIAFTMDDDKKVYFESYWKECPITGKTGVHGPVPWSKLQAWIKEDKSHFMVEQHLPYDRDACQKAYDFLEHACVHVRYPMGQLYSNAKTFLFGAGMRIKDVTETEWTCSETAARVWAVMDPEAVIKHLDIGNILWDMVAPSGPKYGLYEALEKFLYEQKTSS